MFMIHQSNTDGDRFVAIYKPMSDEERSALLKQWWEKKENRWATRFEAPIFSIDLRSMSHAFRTNGSQACVSVN